MPGTVVQLIKKSGYHRSTIERQLRKLRAAGKSHIVDWARPEVSGPFAAIHGVGPGSDAPCTLQPLTDSEDWQLRKDRYGMDLLRAKERALRWALKARRQGDPGAAWIRRK